MAANIQHWENLIRVHEDLVVGNPDDVVHSELLGSIAQPSQWVFRIPEVEIDITAVFLQKTSVLVTLLLRWRGNNDRYPSQG